MRSRLLDVLDEAERSAVLKATRRRVFKRNDVVFHDGDPGDTLHLIVKGHFAVRVTTPLGDVATLRALGPGEHFGELAVLDEGPRNGTVVSLEHGETMALHRDVVEEFREHIPKIDAVLTTALVAEVRRLADALVDALYVPAERRVWRRLRELVDLYGVGDCSRGDPGHAGRSGAAGGDNAPDSQPGLARWRREGRGDVGEGSDRGPRPRRAGAARALTISSGAAGTSGSSRNPWRSSRVRRTRSRTARRVPRQAARRRHRSRRPHPRVCAARSGPHG